MYIIYPASDTVASVSASASNANDSALALALENRDSDSALASEVVALTTALNFRYRRALFYFQFNIHKNSMYYFWHLLLGLIFVKNVHICYAYI